MRAYRCYACLTPAICGECAGTGVTSSGVMLGSTCEGCYGAGEYDCDCLPSDAEDAFIEPVHR
jgi:hypothetical protein